MAILTGITWLWVAAMTLPRATSGAVSDYGFFTSVAERLRSGDTLYVEVWDNKDPFVFYFLAVARNIGPNGVVGAWLLEISWIVLAAIALFVIARSVAISRVLSVFAAFVLAPVVVLGMAYFMGNTHVPAIGLLLAAIALLYRNHPLAAGIALGVLVFFKLVMVPMALVTAAIALIALRKRAAWLPALVGFAGTLATIGVILAVRGELLAFLDAQVRNVLYSQSPIVSAEYTSLVQKVGQHLVILINPHVAGAIAVTAAIGVVTMPWWKGNQGRWQHLGALWWITASAFTMAGITIAVTGKWFHHAEIFAASSTLVLVLLIGWLTAVRSLRSWIAGVIAGILTFPLALSPPAAHIFEPVINLPANWRAATTIDPITEVLQEQEPASVAFVGELLPRSPGLEDWTIACRHVAQRPFNPEVVFTETLECLPTAQTIVITRNLDPDPNFPAFTRYVEAVQALVSEGYECTDTQIGRICTKSS